MAKLPTSISLDADVKNCALPILRELGLDLSTAVGLFLRQVVREKRIPFEISLNIPNEITEKAIQNTFNGIDVSGPFDSVDALMEDILNAED